MVKATGNTPVMGKEDVFTNYEAETRDELVEQVVEHELRTAWLASVIYKQATRDARPLEEVHDHAVRECVSEDYILEVHLKWDDGDTEIVPVNIGSAAVKAADIHKRFRIEFSFDTD